jgi:hypothetical protein
MKIEIQSSQEMHARHRSGVLALAVACAILLTIAAASSMTVGASDASAIVSVPWKGTGVIYSRFIDGSGRLVAEEWLDRSSGDTRHVDHFYGRVASQFVIVRSGKKIQSWDSLAPWRKTLREVNSPSDPWMQHVSDLILPSIVLQNGLGRLEGPSLVEGRPAVRIAIDSPSETMVVDADPGSLLPMRISSTRFEGSPSGSTIRVHSQAAPPGSESSLRSMATFG